jgi:2-dehydropantoate 2-reductase
MKPEPLRICIVGAGAVGLVYAQYLRRGGASVVLFVKLARAESCRGSFALHRLRFGGRCDSDSLPPFSVLTEVEEVAKEDFDQIWLTVASDALRAPWLEALLGASQRATLVLVQPDLEDRKLVLAHLPEPRLVQGLIGFLSFQSPLPRETHLPDGIAYTLLPFAASTFDGPAAAAVVAALRSGGFAARLGRGLPGVSAERSATTVPIIAGLEVAGWSIEEFVRGPWLATSLSASREALAAVSVTLQRPPAGVRRVLHAPLVRFALSAARRLTPFDLEAYLSFHFTKVGLQTRLMLETYESHARAAGLGADSLRKLRSALGGAEV